MRGFAFCLRVVPRTTKRVVVEGSRPTSQGRSALMEHLIVSTWAQSGRVRLDGPVALTLELCAVRPGSHWTSRGRLSVAGQAAPFPVGGPPLDNLHAVVRRALTSYAWSHAGQVVEVRASTRWAEQARLEVAAREVA